MTVPEAAALFSKPWADSAAMTGNLLSATTGMRQGEILAIRGGDIGESILNVSHAWSPPDGLKSPKNGEARKVPLLPEVRAALLAVLAKNPHTDIPEAERFVFWGERADIPRYDGGFMLDALHSELETTGIDWKARNIVFHGWRHFYAGRYLTLTRQPNWEREIEYMKSKVRSKVEHIFSLVKRVFGYRKAVYRRLAKNTARLYMLFASANLLKWAWSLKPYERHPAGT